MKAARTIRSAAVLAVGALLAAAASGEPLPKSGSVRHAAYLTCQSAAMIDLGPVGSDSAAQCRGIVKALDGVTPFDNLAIVCLEESVARKAGYKFTGTCKETDKAGDSLFLSYEGPESGPITLLGGTGKFSGIAGKGQWSVADAPGNTEKNFAFTLTYGFDWTLP